jgi:hypothetical protein
MLAVKHHRQFSLRQTLRIGRKHCRERCGNNWPAQAKVNVKMWLELFTGTPPYTSNMSDQVWKMAVSSIIELFCNSLSWWNDTYRMERSLSKPNVQVPNWLTPAWLLQKKEMRMYQSHIISLVLKLTPQYIRWLAHVMLFTTRSRVKQPPAWTGISFLLLLIIG